MQLHRSSVFEYTFLQFRRMAGLVSCRGEVGDVDEDPHWADGVGGLGCGSLAVRGRQGQSSELLVPSPSIRM